MNTIDTLLARAQVGLAFITAIAFFALLGIMVFHAASLSQQQLELVASLTSVLGTIFTLQMNYFFARHRPADGPDTSSKPTPVIPAPQPETKK